MTSATASPLSTVVELREYEVAQVRCGVAIAAALAADGHVRVSPTGTPGTYDVRARHKVGILRYPGLELRIIPKVPVSRLLYLAAYSSGYDDAWSDVDALLGDVDDPLSAIAHALAFHAERALRPTPLQGYVTHEAAEVRVRGRLLFDRQIAARAGMLLPAELRYDEFELGIPENRVLKSALILVGRFIRNHELARRIRHLTAQLDGVEPWAIGVPLPEFSFTRLNERYRMAMRLSELVLDGGSIEYSDRSVAGTAFLFNMNHVFESYLEAAVRREIEDSYGGSVEGQHRVDLDIAGTIEMKPDITWYRGGYCLAVLDAKYKRTKHSDFPNADAYQMLAYCTRLGLRRGHLVYADLDGSGTGTSLVRNAGVEIVTTSVDIGGTIETLKASVSDLVRAVVDHSEQRLS